MAACPDSSCHEKLKTVCEKVHGKEGLESKVSQKALGGVVVSVIGVLAIFVIYALGASAIAKDERKENSKQVEVIKQTMAIEFTHIKEKLDEQITTGDIYRVVKQVMRENGNDKRGK